MKELLYIDENFLQTPAVAIEQVLKELHAMLLLARKNMGVHLLHWLMKI